MMGRTVIGRSTLFTDPGRGAGWIHRSESFLGERTVGQADEHRKYCNKSDSEIFCHHVSLNEWGMVNKSLITVAVMVRAQYRPTNAVEMTNTVLKEFTKTANLRHFFVPREVVPRSMTAKMLTFDCDDNPAVAYFSLNLTENME
jgi:hypothetical protein